MRIIEDQAKSDENSTIQTTEVLNAEVEKIEDIGKTADLLEILYDPADILPEVNKVAIPCSFQCFILYNLHKTREFESSMWRHL